MIFCIGCCAHIIYNCKQYFTTNIEDRVTKIYTYLYVFTARRTKLKYFCNKLKSKKEKMQHGSIHFIFSVPSVL